MSALQKYQMFEIPGSFLIPGFSIYLLEILYEKERWFYVGMTGDPFYPSARAAFHRISGHLELSNNSTQNQLMVALKEKGLKEDDFNDLIIRMHHFPIKGYKKWTLSKSMHSKEVKKHINSSDYIKYRNKQKEVANFENALIFNLKQKLGNNLINKTSVENESIKNEYEPILKDILNIINK